jgi:hypothetical protein
LHLLTGGQALCQGAMGGLRFGEVLRGLHHFALQSHVLRIGQGQLQRGPGHGAVGSVAQQHAELQAAVGRAERGGVDDQGIEVARSGQFAAAGHLAELLQPGSAVRVLLRQGVAPSQRGLSGEYQKQQQADDGQRRAGRRAAPEAWRRALRINSGSASTGFAASAGRFAGGLRSRIDS